MQAEFLEELLRSKLFLEWSLDPTPTAKPSTVTAGRGRSFIYVGKKYTNLIVDEKHFEPAELAKAWGVSAETIRNVFRNEPGVLRIAHPNGRKRKYISMRVPVSVAERVHKRLSAVPQ